MPPHKVIIQGGSVLLEIQVSSQRILTKPIYKNNLDPVSISFTLGYIFV